MNELIFLITEAPEGGYSARALGQSIFTEADTIDGLRRNIRNAVACHFDDGTASASTLLRKVDLEHLANKPTNANW